MKRLIAVTSALLVAAPLMASISMPAEAADTPAPAVKVLSYNVRGPGAAERNKDRGYFTWEKRKNKQVQLVLEQKPAIFGLQEASTSSKVRAKDFLVPRYKTAGYSAYVPKGGSPKLIFWKTKRFTKVAAGNVRFSVANAKCDQPGRSVAWVRLREINTGRYYFVANTHFATTDVCRSTRVMSARIVHKTIQANAHGAPIIVMGDFNNRQPHCYATNRATQGKAITVMGEPRNSTHTHNLDVTSPSGCARTTHGNWPHAKAGTGKSRIDFLFHSKGKLAASNYKIVTKRTLPIMKNGRKTGTYTSASDHYPIVATFRRR